MADINSSSSEVASTSDIEIEISVDDSEENILDLDEDKEKIKLFKTEVTNKSPETDPERVDGASVSRFRSGPRRRQTKLSRIALSGLVGSSLKSRVQAVPSPASCSRDCPSKTTLACTQRSARKAGRTLCPGDDLEHLQVPFHVGWKRELVHRNTSPDPKSKKILCDVYYFTPGGRKLRSMVELASYLKAASSSAVNLTHFSFKRELLFHPPEEIVRTAGKIGRKTVGVSAVSGGRTDQDGSKKEGRKKTPGRSSGSLTNSTSPGEDFRKPEGVGDSSAALTPARPSMARGRPRGRTRKSKSSSVKLIVSGRFDRHAGRRTQQDSHSRASKSPRNSNLLCKETDVEVYKDGLSVSQSSSRDDIGDDDEETYLQNILGTPSKLIASIVRNEPTKRAESKEEGETEQSSKRLQTVSDMSAQHEDVSVDSCVAGPSDRCSKTLADFKDDIKQESCNRKDTGTTIKILKLSTSQQVNSDHGCRVRLISPFVAPQRLDSLSAPTISPQSLSAQMPLSSSSSQFLPQHVLSPIILIPGQSAALIPPPPPLISCPQADTSVALLPVNVTLTVPPPLQLYAIPNVSQAPPLRLRGSVLSSESSANSFIQHLPILQPCPSLLRSKPAAPQPSLAAPSNIKLVEGDDKELSFINVITATSGLVSQASPVSGVTSIRTSTQISGSYPDTIVVSDSEDMDDTNEEALTRSQAGGKTIQAVRSLLNMRTQRSLLKNDMRQCRQLPSDIQTLVVPVKTSMLPLSLHQDEESFRGSHQSRHHFLRSFRMLQTSFTIMMNIFGNLSLLDLLRASSVCKTWHTLAMQTSLWRFVHLDGIKITDWEKAVHFFNKVGVKSLNLKGVLFEMSELASSADVWDMITRTIPTLTQLEELFFDQVPASILDNITEKMPQLAGVGAESITDSYSA